MIKKLLETWQTQLAEIRWDLPNRPASWCLAVDGLRLLLAVFVAGCVFTYGPQEGWYAHGLVLLAVGYSAATFWMTLRRSRPWFSHRLGPWLEAGVLCLFLMATGGGESPYLRLLVLQSIAVTFVYGSLIGAMSSAVLTLMLVGLVLFSPLPNSIEGFLILATVWGGFSAISLLNSAAVRAQLEAEAQAHRAQELHALNEAKYQFISIVSHELRTPLTIINGYGKLLRSGMIGSDPAELLDVSCEISKAADRMGLLIDELLDFGRLQSGQLPLTPERFTYDELVQDVVRVLTVLASEKQQRLRLTLASHELVVHADPRRIEQVLINLLHNALKYSPERTEVHVTVRAEAGRIRTEILDEGPGITADHLAHLFTPFYRAGAGNRRDDVAGIGLGLAICQGIVTAHGGQIGVESVPGESSMFWFELPVASSVPEPVLED